MLLLSVNIHLLSLPPPNLKKNEKKSILSTRILYSGTFHTSILPCCIYSFTPDFFFLLLFVFFSFCSLGHFSLWVVLSYALCYLTLLDILCITSSLSLQSGHHLKSRHTCHIQSLRPFVKIKKQNKKQLVVKHFTPVYCQSICSHNILHIDKILIFICFSVHTKDGSDVESTIIQDVLHSHSCHFPLMSIDWSNVLVDCLLSKLHSNCYHITSS